MKVGTPDSFKEITAKAWTFTKDQAVVLYESAKKFLGEIDWSKLWESTMFNASHMIKAVMDWALKVYDAIAIWFANIDWSEAIKNIFTVSEDLGVLLDEYGSKLDVIYDDNLALDNTYKEYIFWNGTTITP